MSQGAVSVAFQGDKSVGAYAALARLAEDLGFDGVSVYADLGFQPAIVPLLAMASATTRVRLGPAALNPSLLHPVEIAGQIAALDSVSRGRAYLGLARGAWLDALGVTHDRPLIRLREAIVVIRRLLAGNRDGYEGSIFRLAPGFGFNYPVPRSTIPLLIGTWGPKLAALAGGGRGRDQGRWLGESGAGAGAARSPRGWGDGSRAPLPQRRDRAGGGHGGRRGRRGGAVEGQGGGGALPAGRRPPGPDGRGADRNAAANGGASRRWCGH